MVLRALPRPSRTTLGLLGLLALAACSESGSEESSGAAAPPPTEVGVVTATAGPLPVTNELPGRIAPTRIAEVRPRVSGIIVERVFEQGSMVEAGDVLYRIDPEPFRVQVENAEGTLKRAEAGQLQARQEADRQTQLRQRGVASDQAYDNAVGALAQADADVAIAHANLAAARLDLEYADVKAPISGRIGRAMITEGALVNANSADQVLAIIQQLDPVYADFTQSANQLLQLRRALDVGALTSADPGEASVRLLMDDGSDYGYGGRLLFSEATVDATTGQITLRGEFPNTNGDLLPGMYVRVQIQQGLQANAIAVPQRAVQRDTAGRAQLYIVKDDSTTELRTVTAGRVVGQQWVIDAGLEAGERVVVEGFQKIRPGIQVSAQEWSPDRTVSDDATSDGAAGRTAG
ncbi:efflux RND transporter periplasmic adaptor subunit [Marinivivus vitaminiproducens]|uniref:efflux RND transporter periplasmic adaptor subunit n=1 Tax=Marinivivus vitaminiproducens TaxID=3035935 RepID=UPI0027A06430|nr:efflux RND transporter periplasmic adaptor subunit [Geminicoccaceae bacterium SCSIO 64248]